MVAQALHPHSQAPTAEPSSLLVSPAPRLPFQEVLEED